MTAPKGPPQVPRLSLAEGEPEHERIREVLGERFELVLSVPHSCHVRLVGPTEIEAQGSRLLRQHRLRFPSVPVVVVFASAPENLIRDCFREGAADVIPLAELEQTLVRAVNRALQRAHSGREQEEEARRMASELGKHARELEKALLTVREGYDQTLAALVSALDCRERETAWHSQRVALYSVLVGIRVGLNEVALENLYRGALLHDIGKIGIPDAVLLKPGSFSEEEWEIMRQHTKIGGEILGNIAFLRDASDVPRAHHEAWDGSGYPQGLRGEEIPLHARIFAVIDSYDAIRSKRPYKPAQEHAEAITLLKKAARKRLDPTIVEIVTAEPEQTWATLANSVGESLTFEAAAEACWGVTPQ